MDYTPFTQPSPVTAEVFAPAVPEPVAPPPEPETPVVLYHVKALFQFTAGREDDMSLEADDVIEVEKEDGDWMYGAKGGERGWFPQNFVEKFDPNVIAEPELEPEPAVVEAETVLFRAEAMYDYDAQRDDEVTIKTGDFVDVYRKDGDWWEVVNGESRGVVPRIYLKEVEDAPPLVPIKARHEYLAVGGVPQMRVGSEYSIASQPVVDADFGNIGMAREGSGAHSARGSVAGQHWVSVVAQNDFERLTLDERKRQESIFELIQTEQSYVRDLQIIFEVFYQPITQLLSKQDVDTIFSNLEDILMTNTIILSDWEEAQKQSDYVIMNIGTLFERNALALDCYKIYCSNLMVASKLLQKRRQESEKLQDFLKNCQRNAQCRSLDLSSFLLQPMQRVTRYTLIFKQILNYTPQGHPEHAAVVRAAQVADRMATLVNMAAREQESKEKIEALIAQIDFDASSEFGRIDLLGPTRFGSARLYVFDSALSKAKSGRKLHGYIFTDMILLLQQQKNLGVFNDAKPMYTLYHAPIPVDQCTVRDAPRSSGVDECTFQIVAPGDIITVKAPSASVKAKWLSNHDTALANFLAYSR
ncbi:Dbl homology domain-containing protein [Chytridium lagenaria]|nr:Dbl homology domain-containing protein [Chytridium lagenaria]